MFHQAFSTFFTPPRRPLHAALPGDALVAEPGLRAHHARALAYAAQRRRSALASREQEAGVDVAYWKAGVPAAIARATALRGEPRFARLP